MAHRFGIFPQALAFVYYLPSGETIRVLVIHQHDVAGEAARGKWCVMS